MLERCIHTKPRKAKVASLHPTFNDACVLIHKIEAVLLVLCLTVPSFILKEKNGYYMYLTDVQGSTRLCLECRL